MTSFVALTLMSGVAACTEMTSVAINSVTTTKFTVAGSRLYMSGEINARTVDQFDAIMAANPGIDTLVEVDIPGSVDEDAMIDLGYRIRNLGLNTHLTASSQIYSGGVDVFLAGQRRTMAPGAIIGVHAWADNIKKAHEYPVGAPEHEANRRYVQDMLGSDGFYWFTIHAAPADGVHIMTPAEIARFRLITG